MVKGQALAAYDPHAEKGMGLTYATSPMGADHTSGYTVAVNIQCQEAQGIEIDEIARRTKISAAHLRAIEAEDFSSLPALVYTRGFVQQVARYLGLDPSQVSRTYLRRLRMWRASTGEPGP